MGLIGDIDFSDLEPYVSARLNGEFFEYPVDLDGDGLYGGINLSIGVEIYSSSFYKIDYDGYCPYGNGSLDASGLFYLDPGVYNISVIFSGEEIIGECSSWGGTGSFFIRWVSFYDEMQGSLLEELEPNFDTRDYFYDEFEESWFDSSQPIIFEGLVFNSMFQIDSGMDFYPFWGGDNQEYGDNIPDGWYYGFSNNC